MSSRLLRNALTAFVPNWLANRPGFNVGFSYLYAIALVGDCMIENGYQGFQAALGIGTPTALPLVAQSRGILQGPVEPDANFLPRLWAWLATYQKCGADEILAQQIQAFLTSTGGVLPTVYVINRSGLWVTALPNGTTTFQTTSWNWDDVFGFDDGQIHPPAVVPGYWSDVWIVVYPDPFPRYTSLSDANWRAAWGGGAGWGVGHEVPRVYVDGILQLVSIWKGAHTFLRAIIWSISATDYSPSNPTAVGKSGNDSFNVAGVQTPLRDATARYWQPQSGG